MADEQNEPKISLPEVIIVGGFLSLVDAVELAIVFFGFDDFWISDAIAFPATQIYLRWKGVKGLYSFIGNSVELIPYVGWFPTRTIAFVITVIVDRRQARQQVESALKQAAASPRARPAAPRARPTAPARANVASRASATALRRAA